MAKKFETYSLQTQKKKIVEDAILQIQLKKYKPKEGVYFRLESISKQHELLSNPVIKLAKTDSLQESILSQDTQCTVCAKGGLFASCVAKTNQVYGYKSSEPFMKKKLSTWFKALELDMIEASFEGCRMVDSTKQIGYGSNLDKCLKFYAKYKTDKGRMLAILNNILKNGEFKP